MGCLPDAPGVIHLLDNVRLVLVLALPDGKLGLTHVRVAGENLIIPDGYCPREVALGSLEPNTFFIEDVTLILFTSLGRLLQAFMLLRPLLRMA